MKKLTAIAAIGAAMTMFAAASPASADGWDRSRTVIGPHGGEHEFEGRGYCDEDGCASRQRWRGPHGRTLTRRGHTECHDDHCERTSVWVGPRGHKRVVRHHFHRY